MSNGDDPKKPPANPGTGTGTGTATGTGTGTGKGTGTGTGHTGTVTPDGGTDKPPQTKLAFAAGVGGLIGGVVGALIGSCLHN